MCVYTYFYKSDVSSRVRLVKPNKTVIYLKYCLYLIFRFLSYEVLVKSESAKQVFDRYDMVRGRRDRKYIKNMGRGGIATG